MRLSKSSLHSKKLPFDQNLKNESDLKDNNSEKSKTEKYDYFQKHIEKMKKVDMIAKSIKPQTKYKDNDRKNILNSEENTTYTQSFKNNSQSGRFKDNFNQELIIPFITNQKLDGVKKESKNFSQSSNVEKFNQELIIPFDTNSQFDDIIKKESKNFSQSSIDEKFKNLIIPFDTNLQFDDIKNQSKDFRESNVDEKLSKIRQKLKTKKNKQNNLNSYENNTNTQAQENNSQTDQFEDDFNQEIIKSFVTNEKLDDILNESKNSSYSIAMQYQIELRDLQINKIIGNNDITEDQQSQCTQNENDNDDIKDQKVILREILDKINKVNNEVLEKEMNSEFREKTKDMKDEKLNGTINNSNYQKDENNKEDLDNKYNASDNFKNIQEESDNPENISSIKENVQINKDMLFENYFDYSLSDRIVMFDVDKDMELKQNLRNIQKNHLIFELAIDEKIKQMTSKRSNDFENDIVKLNKLKEKQENIKTENEIEKNIKQTRLSEIQNDIDKISKFKVKQENMQIYSVYVLYVLIKQQSNDIQAKIFNKNQQVNNEINLDSNDFENLIVLQYKKDKESLHKLIDQQFKLEKWLNIYRQKMFQN